MKYFSGGSYLIMKSTQYCIGGIPLMAIGYKFDSRKVLGFVATERDVSTESGDPCLYRFPDMYYNVSIRPVVCTNFLGRYYNAYNAIDKQNGMPHSDISLI